MGVKMCYNKFYVDGCEKKEKSHILFQTILSFSDALSLVYFKYKENEKLSKSAAQMKRHLVSYKIHSQNVIEWPGTKTLNDNGHIYQMITYRIDNNLRSILDTVDTIWDWDYPAFPMDPAFYKDGYCWFQVTAHERLNTLFLKEDNLFPSLRDFENIGVTLIPKGKATESELFFNKYARLFCQ